MHLAFAIEGGVFAESPPYPYIILCAIAKLAQIALPHRISSRNKMESRVEKIFDPSSYLDAHYKHLQKPDGEQYLMETILVKLHEFIGKGRSTKIILE